MLSKTLYQQLRHPNLKFLQELEKNKIKFSVSSERSKYGTYGNYQL